MKSKVLGFIIALTCPIVLFGQISASKTSGCAPLTQVVFSNLTTGDWNFDDGSSGTGTSVTHSYSSAGTYNVVFSQAGVDVGTIVINVFSNPSPSFDLTGPASGCVPLNTSFNDVSTGGGGVAITDWNWSFGDGGGATSKSPNWDYTITGTYTVSLIVTDANGCDSSITKTDLISVNNAPVPSFSTTPNPANACVGPLTVGFNNVSLNSTGGTTDLTYDWDFGNGETSSLKDPADVVYSADGNYIVRLTISELGGCSRSIARSVSVGGPQAIPDIPDTVCHNRIFNPLLNVSTGATSYKWEFKGGPTYFVKNPNHTFNVAGLQEITLTASSNAGCSDDTTFFVFVEDIDVDFTRNPTYLCDDPYCITFDGQSTSSNIASWSWNFGDGSGVTGRSEDTTYCYDIHDTVYYVHNYYYFTASVTATSSNGCTATAVKQDTIFPVSSFFVPDVTDGCLPLTVNFLDSTRSRETVTNWEYIFADGTTSNAQNPTHIFTTAGDYDVVLVSTNSFGCKDTSFPVTISVGEPIPLNFSATPTTICIGDTVTFADNSADPRIDYVHFEVNDNQSGGCVTNGTQKWADFTNVGQQDVTMHANYNGCITTSTLSNEITVEGPVSKLRYTGICASPLDYTFIGEIQGATSWDWDFGDGTVIVSSPDATVNHTYAVSGDYVVKLTTHNTGTSCASHVAQLTANVRQITAVITGDTSLCDAVSYNFSGITSTDVYNDCDDAYRWDLGEKTIPRTREDGVIDFAFQNPGAYTVRLITHDINNCRDTTTQNVIVSTVTAKIGADTLKGCLPFTIALSDLSTSDTIITKWSWSKNNGQFSTSQNTSVTIDQVGNNTISLNVTDSLGCADVTSFVVAAIIPDTNFLAITDRTICAGDSVQFRANNAGAIGTFNWTFEGGGSSTAASPFAVYPAGGLFSATLSVVDTNGCAGSNTRTSYIEVEDVPVAGFSTSEDSNSVICFPQIIDFADTSSGKVISWDWDLGTGGAVINAANVTSPNYPNPGTYTTTLIVETAFGCKDTATKDIEIVGPIADFDMSKNLICSGEKVTFTIKDTTDVFTYLWDFGDGTDATEQSPVTHTYSNVPHSLQTVVQLIAWANDSACERTFSEDLYFKEVAAVFGFADDTICLNETLSVLDSSIGADTYAWTVSNGESYSIATLPALSFSSAGVHSVELVVENNLISCVDTLKKELMVQPIPAIAAKDEDFCLGDTIRVEATGYSGLTYRWVPDLLVDDPDSAKSISTAGQSTDFTILVTDSNACTNTDVANIYIQVPFDPETIDTCVIIGDPFTLGRNLGDRYTYKWEGTESDLEWLNCKDCAVQDVMIVDEVGTVYYTLVYEDTLGCFSNEITYNVCVIPSYTFDVPSAFTPDGDGFNDKVFVRGHGIKTVLEFKIFNRWGEVVFESTTLNEGWDGIYKETDQGIETYIYQAKVEFYNGTTDEKGGTITIVR